MTTVKEQTRKDNVKNTGLKKCFTALVDRKQVNLDMEVLKLMLKKELQINLESLDQHLATVIPLMLVTYMKTWPGWHRSKEYYSGKLNFKEWYEKFKQYIVLRLNFLIKNGYNTVVEEIESELKSVTSSPKTGKLFTNHGTQTDSLAPRGFAPFTISIDCSPHVMNSLVFTDSKDNIVIKQHPDIAWTQIDIKQLIHWPHIEVEFLSPELSFKRRNVFDFKRYINFVNIPLTHEKSDFIEQIEIIEPTSGRNCYTLHLLKCYVKQYVRILRRAASIDDKDVNIIEILLEEFLNDIKEIGMNCTMATNTSVIFNIGKCTFLRNKKISKGTYCRSGSNGEVGFCEIITPKMETALNYFKGIQDVSTPTVTFKYLNNLIADNKNVNLETSIPTLTYKCTFCNIKYKTDTGVLKHLEIDHRMDPNVLCIKCKKSYTVHDLASQRWNHVCNVTPLHQTKPILIK